jgi:CMP-N,N'-diacetyllegionaminic acid synthase
MTPQSDSILALITARGGSKGIPGKNIVPLAGKPLLAWTVEAARAARGIERVLLSTDCPQIRAAGIASGAQAPFLRPAELAQDDTPSIDVVLHALQWLEEHENYKPRWVLLLQPTSPLRTTTDIEKAVELAIGKQPPAVVSVCEVGKHPYWTKTMDAEGRLSNLITGVEAYTRRQDMPSAYALNGALYLVDRDVLLKQKSFCPPGALAYVMPQERSLDVDTPWDLRLVELILKEHSHAVI